MKKIKVAISQRIIPHYRIPVFTELSRRDNIDLTVFYGDGFPSGSQANADKIYGFKAVKLKTIKLNYSRGYGSPQLRVWHPALFQKLIKGKFDVVIVEPSTNFYNDIFAFLYCKIFRKKFIWYDAGSVLKNKRALFRRLIDPILSIFIRFSDAYITYTSYADHSLKRDFNIEDKKIFRAQNTVDTSMIDEELIKYKDIVPLKKKELKIEGYKVAMYIGGLEKRKKINNLITAVYMLNKKGIKSKVLIVGDGMDKNWIESNMNEHEKSHTIFAGKQITEATLYIMLSDVVVLPSQGGLSVMQAFACKKPFIGSEEIEHGGIKDYVQNGINGFLIRENNIDDLSNALYKVFTNEILYKKLCRGAYSTSKKITIQNMVNGIENAIKYTVPNENSTNK